MHAQIGILVTARNFNSDFEWFVPTRRLEIILANLFSSQVRPRTSRAALGCLESLRRRDPGKRAASRRRFERGREHAVHFLLEAVQWQQEDRSGYLEQGW